MIRCSVDALSVFSFKNVPEWDMERDYRKDEEDDQSYICFEDLIDFNSLEDKRSILDFLSKLDLKSKTSNRDIKDSLT